MTGLERDPAAMLRIVYAAAAEAGCRAIVQADVRGSKVPEHPDVFPIGFAPHDELFPRCAAVVHHGGAGTTQSALRSGRPSIIVAHITDQFFWGPRLHRLGVGPPHLSRRTLTAHALARSIRAALDEPRFAKQSADVGYRMRQEDGVHEAIASLERAVWVHRGGRRARV